MLDERYNHEFEKELEENEIKEYRESIEEFLDLLENEAPYKPMKLTHDKLFNITSIYYDFKISMYCEKCKKVHYFAADGFMTDAFAELMEINDDTPLKDIEWECGIEVHGGKGCNQTHHLPVLIKNSQIQKIGQYPPFDENLTAARLRENK